MRELFQELNDSLAPGGQVIWRATTHTLQKKWHGDEIYWSEQSTMQAIGYPFFDSYHLTVNLTREAYEPGNDNHLAPSINTELNKRFIDMIA